MTQPETHWIIALEEDPESGDLFMTIPEEVMASQEWNIGDILTWGISEDDVGSVTLSKK